MVTLASATVPSIFGPLLTGETAKIRSDFTSCPNLKGKATTCTKSAFNSFLQEFKPELTAFRDPASIANTFADLKTLTSDPKNYCSMGNATSKDMHKCEESMNAIHHELDNIKDAVGSIVMNYGSYMNELARITIALGCSFCEDATPFTGVSTLYLDQQYIDNLDTQFNKSIEAIAKDVSNLADFINKLDDSAISAIDNKTPGYIGFLKELKSFNDLTTKKLATQASDVLNLVKYDFISLKDVTDALYWSLIGNAATLSFAESTPITFKAAPSGKHVIDISTIYNDEKKPVSYIDLAEFQKAGFSTTAPAPLKYTTSGSTSSSKGLSGGKIAAAVIMSIVGFIIIVGLVWWYVKRSHKTSSRV